MRDFTQEQKGSSGMEDLQFGYVLRLVVSRSPFLLRHANHPSGMGDFTQEQKGQSGMEDLPLGYEESLIAEQHVQIHRVFTFKPHIEWLQTSCCVSFYTCFCV